jgi:CheY-like chemotaxis protein
VTISEREGPVLLYVEDDPHAAQLFEIAIAESSVSGVVRLFTVVDGQQAIDFVRHIGAFQNAPKPDLLLLDLHLPIRDGLSVLQELQTIDDVAGVPVIIFSTSIDRKEREQAFALGAQDFFHKPSDMYGFFEAADQVCQRLKAEA